MKLESTLSGQRETELEKELQESKAAIENLKAGFMEKEAEWQNKTEETASILSTGNNGQLKLSDYCYRGIRFCVCPLQL